MSDKKPYNDERLNELFDDVLSGLKEDLDEATQNVEIYKKEIINNTMGKEAFGQLYNDALRIKGQARERVLKAINLIKERIKVKEVIQKERSDGGGNTNPEEIVSAIDKMNNESNQK